jgi:hypothetical protein
MTLDAKNARAVLVEVLGTLEKMGANTGSPCGIRYPLGIPRMHDHLGHLAELAMPVMEGVTHDPDVLRHQICDACPYQFPRAYCPSQRTGGCSLIQSADRIVGAVATALSGRVQARQAIPTALREEL